MDDELATWLDAHGLARYAPLLRREEIDLGLLARLTDADLRELGLPLGPRRVIRTTLGGGASAEPAEAASDAVARLTADRRRMTILFCDLVDSTPLTLRLDPEVVHEILRDFEGAVSRVIRRYGGHVARFLGDGMLAYFGWPRAFEDQAQRGVLAARDVLGVVARLRPREDLELAVRIGIATGEVVVGDLGCDAGHVTGATPNLAQRLQAEALPGEIVVCGRTRAIAGDLMRTESRGTIPLKGFPAPVAAFTVVDASELETRFEGRHDAALSPYVGRDGELRLARERWQAARRGEGQVLLVTGEAGIGKSRLVRALMETVADEAHFTLSYQCVSYETSTPFHPVLARIRRDAGIVPGEAASVSVGRLEALLARSSRRPRHDLPLLAHLLSIPISPPYRPVTADTPNLAARIAGMLVEQIVGLAAEGPLLVVAEDVHWIDPSTEAVLVELARRVAGLPVLLVLTHRGGAVPDLGGPVATTHLELGRLAHAESLAVARHHGPALSEATLEQVVARAEGVPLHVEELAKAASESAEERVPATIESLFLERLDRLGTARELALLVSAVGRTVTEGFLRRLATGSPDALAGLVADLLGSGLFVRRGRGAGATFRFRHALIQEVAYGSLLRATRRRFHARIADAMLSGSDAEALAEPQALARHLSLADRPMEAVGWWLAAGRAAAGRAADREASELFEAALADLGKVEPSQARDRAEFEVRVGLGASLVALEGWSSERVAENYDLTRRIPSVEAEPARLFVALRGQANVHFLRGELGRTQTFIDRLLAIARASGEEDQLIEAYRSNGMCALVAGRAGTARDYLERANALYDRDRHHRLAFVYGTDPGVVGLAGLSWALWFHGEFDRAETASRRAIALARAVEHPFSLSYALCFAASLAQFADRTAEAEAHADAAIRLAGEHDYPYWLGWALILKGWAGLRRGRAADGLADFRRGLAVYLGTGARQILPYAAHLAREAARGGADPSDVLGDLGMPADPAAGEVRFFLRTPAGGPIRPGRGEHRPPSAAAGADPPPRAAASGSMTRGDRR